MTAEKTGTLASLITEATLREFAEPRSFERGTRYYQSGAVEELVDTGSSVRGRVVGTTDYRVVLRAEGDDLEFYCDCPVGESGEFCKHAVALGLAWLAEAGGPNRSAGPTDDDIRRYLLSRDKEELVDRLMERADDDPAYMQHLQTEALASDTTADPKALKRSVRRALEIRGYVDYRSMRRFLERARPAADLVARLLAEGRAEAAMDLGDYALQRGLAACERLDDSDGGFGDLLTELWDLFLDACRAAAPDGKTLAQRVLKLQLADPWGFIELEDFLPLLGEEGLAEYRRRAEREWAKVPARGPGESSLSDPLAYHRLADIMETLAARDGDVDALVAVKRRDLTAGYHFLELAQLLEHAGRDDEALEWAEQGRAAFGSELNVPLTEYLIEAYQARGRHADAVAEAWAHFQAAPSLSAYRRLMSAAEQAGERHAQGERALDWVRHQYLKGRQRKRYAWETAPSALAAEILLWEGDVDAALAEVRAGSAPEGLWLKLAKALEAERPGEAAAIYQEVIDSIVNQKHNDAYDRAVELADTVHALMRRADRQHEFAEYAHELRRRHKQKRNFVQRLDKMLAAEGIETVAPAKQPTGRQRHRGPAR